MHVLRKPVETPAMVPTGRRIASVSGGEAVVGSPARALQQRLERAALRSFYAPSLDRRKHGGRARMQARARVATVIAGCVAAGGGIVTLLARIFG